MAIFIQTNFICLWVLFLFVFIPQTNEAVVDSLQHNVSKEIDVENTWDFNYLGKSMAEFLADYIDGPVYDTVKDTIERALYDKRNTLTSFTSSTFATQSLITVGVVVSALIISCLIISPLLIILFRRRIKSSNGKTWTPVHTLELFLFEAFNLSCFTAVIGAIILIISSIQAYKAVLPFSFANHSVEVVYSYKELFNHVHNKRVRGILSNTYDSTTNLIANSETAGKTYTTRIQTEFESVLKIAEELRLQLVYSADILEHQKNRIDKMLSGIIEQSRLYANDYIKTVNLLKEHEEFVKVLDPILKLPEYTITTNVTTALLVPIQTLKEAQKPDLASGIQEVYNNLKIAASKPHYNPYSLIIKLQNLAFNVERGVRTLVEKYLGFMEKSFLDIDQDLWNKKIEKLKKDLFAPSTVFHGSILFLVTLSIVCIITSVLAYTSLMYAPEYNKGSSNALVKISGFSKSWGSVLFFSTFAISCFLWLLWILNTFLFILAFLPLEICKVIEDKSVFNATIDNESFQNVFHFFHAFSSPKFSMTAYETLSKCSTDNTYLAFLPDTLVSKEDRNNILSELNFTDAISSFEDSIKMLSFNIPTQDSSLYNLSHILDDVNLKIPFKELKEVLENVTQLNASNILRDIYTSSNDSLTSQLALRASNAYKNLKEELQRGSPFEKVLNASLNQVNATLRTIHKQFTDFVWISDGLHEKLPEYPSVYNLTLKGTIAGMVDTFFSTMRAEIRGYRKSISFCEPLTNLHEKSKTVFCQIALYPLVLCWMGSFIICFSLIFTVTIGVVTSLRVIAAQKTQLITLDQMENGSKTQIDESTLITNGEKPSTSNTPQNQLSRQYTEKKLKDVNSLNAKEDLSSEESTSTESPPKITEMYVLNEEINADINSSPQMETEEVIKDANLSSEGNKASKSSPTKVNEMDDLIVERDTVVDSLPQMETEVSSINGVDTDEGNITVKSPLPKITEMDYLNVERDTVVDSSPQTETGVSSNDGEQTNEVITTISSLTEVTEMDGLNVEKSTVIDPSLQMETEVSSKGGDQSVESSSSKKPSPNEQTNDKSNLSSKEHESPPSRISSREKNGNRFKNKCKTK